MRSSRIVSPVADRPRVNCVDGRRILEGGDDGERDRTSGIPRWDLCREMGVKTWVGQKMVVTQIGQGADTAKLSIVSLC